jgi:uncharacterized protein Usg
MSVTQFRIKQLLDAFTWQHLHLADNVPEISNMLLTDTA